jgi:hypothetical protein
MADANISAIGKYRTIELVGEGAMGVVYRASGPGQKEWVLSRTENKELRYPVAEVLRTCRGRRQEGRAARERDQPKDAVEPCSTISHRGPEIWQGR